MLVQTFHSTNDTFLEMINHWVLSNSPIDDPYSSQDILIFYSKKWLLNIAKDMEIIIFGFWSYQSHTI
jgi:hypothetical protein